MERGSETLHTAQNEERHMMYDVTRPWMAIPRQRLCPCFVLQFPHVSVPAAFASDFRGCMMTSPLGVIRVQGENPPFSKSQTTGPPCFSWTSRKTLFVLGRNTATQDDYMHTHTRVHVNNLMQRHTVYTHTHTHTHTHTQAHVC